MVWRHPKYYKELAEIRKRFEKEQADKAASNKPTSAQAQADKDMEQFQKQQAKKNKKIKKNRGLDDLQEARKRSPKKDIHAKHLGRIQISEQAIHQTAGHYAELLNRKLKDMFMTLKELSTNVHVYFMHGNRKKAKAAAEEAEKNADVVGARAQEYVADANEEKGPR